MHFPYVYFWHRQDRKGRSCRVAARGKMNSCCVEFEDGYKMITSRNAIRKRAVGVATLANGDRVSYPHKIGTQPS